jgi:hypothetical protein
MKADDHRHKAERIERSLTALGHDDWEMKIEAAMLAGTHWANYALHCRGVTPPSEDILHVSMLVLNTIRKYSIVEGDLLRCLTEVEELRPLHVRGDAPGSQAAAERALELLAEMGRCARLAGTAAGA